MVKNLPITESYGQELIDKVIERFRQAFALEQVPLPILRALDGVDWDEIEQAVSGSIHPFPGDMTVWEEMFDAIPRYILNCMWRAVDKQGEPTAEPESVVEFLVHLSETWCALDSVQFWAIQMPCDEIEFLVIEVEEDFRETTAEPYNQVAHCQDDPHSEETSSEQGLVSENHSEGQING